MDIPDSVEAWTPETINALLEAQYKENDLIEYKRQINLGPDEDNLKRQKTFASFANAAGGFVVFGIKEERSGGRFEYALSGIDPPADANIAIERSIQGIIPPIKFRTKELTVGDRRVLVAQIFEARDKPVGCSDGSYYIRLTGMKVPMSRSMLADFLNSSLAKRMQRSKLGFEITLMLEAVKDEPPLMAEPKLSSYRVRELIQALSDCSDVLEESSLDLVKRLVQDINDFERHKQMYIEDRDYRRARMANAGSALEATYREEIRQLTMRFNNDPHRQFCLSVKYLLVQLKEKLHI